MTFEHLQVYLDCFKNNFVMVSGSPAGKTVTLLVNKSSVSQWYAVYTSPRAEKQIFKRLVDKGIETFLPLQKTYRQWSDRKKMVERPLLSSYIFVNVLQVDFPKVYQTPGVVKFISFEGKPVAIPQNQIDNLKLLINSDAEIEVSGEKFAPGDHVKVTTGSLNGLTGELIKTGRKKRFIIRIDSLEQNLIVTIPPAFLEKI